MLKKLGEKLQKARKSVGLNQVQVAETLGISRGTLINIEKGEVRVDVILLGKLANLYGYSLNHFIEGESTEVEDISFAFRAGELTLEDSHIPAWGRGILLNIRTLEEILEEAGL